MRAFVVAIVLGGAATFAPTARAELLFDPAPLFEIGTFNTTSTLGQLTSLQQAYVAEGLKTLSTSSSLTSRQQVVAQTTAIAIEAYNFIQNVKTIYTVSEADTVQEIAQAISAFDLSAQQTALDSYQSAFNQAVGAYDVNPVVPPIAIYVGVAVDPSIRTAAEQAAMELNTTLAELTSIKSLADSNAALLEAFANRMTDASSVAEARAEALFNLVADLSPSIDPATNFLIIAATQAAGALVLASEEFNQMASQASALASATKAFASTVAQDISQTTDVKNTYVTALTTPLAQTTFTTTGSFSGGGTTINTAGYSINFSGTSFAGSGAVPPSTFTIGSLGFFNGSGFVGTDRYALEVTLTRDIVIPGVGEWIATTESTLNLSYETTPFSEDPRISADRIFLNEIGKGSAVFEGELAFFDIIGSINSPLRFVDVIVQPGYEDVAFITNTPLNSVDEPPVIALLVASIGLLAGARRWLR